MGTRRADGEGSYRQRPNGLWEASTRYTAPDGERKRLSVYGKTRADARGKLNDARKRIAEGAPPVTTSRRSGRGWTRGGRRRCRRRHARRPPKSSIPICVASTWRATQPLPVCDSIRSVPPTSKP